MINPKYRLPAPSAPLLFFLSGISGLVFQTVWFRMLIRVFGSTLEATSTILAVFMGGLAIGAALAGRRAESLREPLRTYAGLELLVALAAVLATAAMAWLPGYIAPLLPESAAGTALLRLAASAALLLPPTILMGATLPLLTRHLSSGTADSGAAISRLYALNTLGAAAGVLACGFLLLGHLGERASVLLAALLNAGIAARIFLSAPENRAPAPAAAASDAPAHRKMLLVMAASGFVALSLEVLWARALVLTVGNSVYAFSAMLSVYLLGIALGSLRAAGAADSGEDAFPALARAQALIAALSAAGLLVFLLIGRTTLDPKYLYSPLSGTGDIAALFGWAALIIFPCTLLMGYFFPLAAQAGVRAAGSVGAVGGLYAANTVGTILGSLATGFLLVPHLGTKFSLLLAAMLAALTALYLAGLAGGAAQRRLAPWLAAAALLPVAALAMPDPLRHIMERRLAANDKGSIVYYNEDRAGAVTVVFSGRSRGLYINAVAVAGNGDAGRLMVRLPLLLQEDPKEMFLVGLGATTSLRAGVQHGVRVTVAELLASVREAGPIFLREWRELAAAGKFRVRLNDGRNELLRTRERYDLIVVDVTPPIFSSGAVNVYSRDFFSLARSRLTKTGMMSLWVPQPCFESDLHMILRSMKEVFPGVQVWHFPGLPGFLAVGSQEQPVLEAGLLASRIKKSGAAAELPYLTPEFINGMLFMDDARVAAAVGQYPPVTDDKPYTEFPLARFLAFSPKW